MTAKVTGRSAVKRPPYPTDSPIRMPLTATTRLVSDITGLSADRRSRIGIGRSYQKTNIFGEFSAFENCRLAAQSRAPRVEATNPSSSSE